MIENVFAINHESQEHTKCLPCTRNTEHQKVNSRQIIGKSMNVIDAVHQAERNCQGHEDIPEFHHWKIRSENIETNDFTDAIHYWNNFQKHFVIIQGIWFEIKMFSWQSDPCHSDWKLFKSWTEYRKKQRYNAQRKKFN